MALTRASCLSCLSCPACEQEGRAAGHVIDGKILRAARDGDGGGADDGDEVNIAELLTAWSQVLERMASSIVLVPGDDDDDGAGVEGSGSGLDSGWRLACRETREDLGHYHAGHARMQASAEGLAARLGHWLYEPTLFHSFIHSGGPALGR